MVAAILMALIAITEVWMFGFLGNIVDWLSAQNRETFLQTEGWKLAGMAFIVLVVLPATVSLHSLINQQTLMGNYPMRIRWQVHRYLLKQSMTFYQDEFAGRIATKLMQTALAVRECVIKLIDVLNYVIVYFLGMLFIVGSADWRLAMPLRGLARLLSRRCCATSCRVSARSAQQQADARSLMTGRVVDSYTNIQTVKLFSHARREAILRHARAWASSCSTVYRSMRLVTQLYGVALRPQLAAAAFGRRAVDLALAGRGRDHRRGRGRDRPGAAAVGHVAVDHVGGVRPVREHRHGAGRHQLDLAAAAGRGQARTRRNIVGAARARSSSTGSASTTARARASSRTCR